VQPGSPDALLAAIAQAGNEVTQGWMRLLSAPGLGSEFPRKEELHAAYLQKQAQLWSAMLAGRRETLVEDGDKRFSGREWRENAYYDYLRQSYLLAAQYVRELVDSAPLDGAQKERARFAAGQWIDAMCPANFPATNPAVLRVALETRGESLTRGMANLIADAQKGRISQTNESAFEVGRDLATTPGDVVYENELIQLIQYRPSTVEVAKRPLVMIPPCINKYYILDLQPDNSFAGHAVAKGQTVFMVSWRNVGPEQGGFGWDDYLELGVFAALRVAREITKADKVNALGFCVGGTLLGAGLSVLAQKDEDIVESVTMLAAMLDFSETGPVGLFVEPAGVAAKEATIGRGGILSGSELAFVFSAVRANDLVWPYVVNNYLLGGQPAAFDLLYWNADSTNLPGPMYCYYLRNTYLENRLRIPGALTNCGVPVDLGRVNLPLFALATREDHIVPWRSAYRTLRLLGGEDKTFLLGASGHVAGVVNPASKNRRSYWIGRPPAGGNAPSNPDEWLAAAEERKGSWWPVWDEWLARHGGGMRRAPAKPGAVKYPVIEAAPGRYVRQRIS
jgi:polyhydroxyalkanoate synthase